MDGLVRGEPATTGMRLYSATLRGDPRFEKIVASLAPK
jgi:hypothetical protein